MKTLLAAALLATAWTASAMAESVPSDPDSEGVFEPKVIYGEDDRLDIYSIHDGRILSLANSTVGLFEGSDVTLAGRKAKLSTKHYGTAYGLCKTERFYDQTIGAFCSGSLVAKDVIMTAGHCVTSQDRCKQIKFVFGFDVTKKGRNPDAVPASNVYGCAELLGREQTNNGADWALIKLDRAVTGRRPLKINLDKPVKDGMPMFVIGHPAGLPTKVAGGAKVRHADPVDPQTQEPLKGFFQANLDTYGGNSGSAVFNGRTLRVEGILVRGETDYVYTDKGCRVSNECKDDACRGEDVTKASAVGFPGSAPHAPRVAPMSKNFASLLSQLDSLTGQTQ